MGEVALRFLQAGLETTKGTGVAATRILMARITNPNFTIPRDFVEEDRGTLVASQRFIQGVKDYTFSVEQQGATFEEIGWLFRTCVSGTESPTTINTAAYSRTITPQTTAGGDDLKAATFEFGDDTQEYECEYCEGDSFTLGFDTLAVGEAAPVKLTVNYITQSLASNTKTAALTLPTVETILATGATFSLGTTSTAYASLSALTGNLRSFNMDWQNKLGRKVFVGDGTTFSNVGRGRRVITFTAMVEGNSDGVSRFVDWDLGTEKRLRILFQGEVISGSSPATTKKLQIDGRFVLTEFDPIGEVDTNTVYNISGRFMPDTALSDAEVQFLLVNGVASYTT
jgi:hypothetical protein